MNIFSRSTFKGIFILILLAVVDQWLFTTWFNSSYPAWYIKNGSTIALLTAFISLSLGDLDKLGMSGLISLDPSEYVAACTGLIGLSLYVVGGSIIKNKKKTDQEKIKTTSEEATQKSESGSISNNLGCWFALGVLGTMILSIIFTLVDFVLFAVFLSAIIALLIAWFIVVTPMQYLVYMVCGTLARQMKRSDSRVIFKIDNDRLVYETLLKELPTPEGMQDLSISNKRIATTNVLATVLFFVLRIFI